MINKVFKSFKFEIYPTIKQKYQLNIEFDNSRFVWNHALSMSKKSYERRKESLNYVSINKHITKLKKTKKFNWLNNSSSTVITQKLIDLDKAYNNFFNKISKYPKFKKKSHHQSIRYAIDNRYVNNNYIAGKLLKIPKLGELNIKWSQVPNGTPKMVTLSKTSTGKYFVIFMCEVEQELKKVTGKVIGIDVGIKDVVVTSDGFYSGSPKFTYKYQRKLKKAQRILSRKTKGSNRYNKQRIVVAKIHEKIANSRKDFLHKLTTKIVSDNDIICIEDLNVSGMLKNRKLSKAVADVGMYELNRQIEYKAQWYGKQVVKISRWEPSTKKCSSCGNIKTMKLSQRTYECECGLNMCRDLNAAHNIKAAGNVVRGDLYQLINI
jgi:putative transposase